MIYLRLPKLWISFVICSKKVSLVAIFYNLVIPKSKNMAKSMAGFSKNTAIFFAMVRRGSIANNYHEAVETLV
jgi:hypothetical protein